VLLEFPRKRFLCLVVDVQSIYGCPGTNVFAALLLHYMANVCFVILTLQWSSSPSLIPPLNLRSEDACVLLNLLRKRFLCLVVYVRSTYGSYGPGSGGFASLLLQGLEDACLVVSTLQWSSSPSLIPPMNPRSEDACVLLELPRQRFLCLVVAVF
jgi:hypothetical protein